MIYTKKCTDSYFYILAFLYKILIVIGYLRPHEKVCPTLRKQQIISTLRAWFYSVASNTGNLLLEN